LLADNIFVRLQEKMGKKLPLSVSIISFNEEQNIGNALASIHDIASEIIVVDSHSTDKTREIARSYGARVFEEDWKGFIAQKASALEKCQKEWVLSIDCDEVVSQELKESIVAAVTDPRAHGYYMNRKTSYLGKFLHHAWQPDWKLRLVNRSASPNWGGYNPHDVLSISGKTEKLDGSLFHYSYRDVRDHFEKVVEYSRVVAEAYSQRGRTFRLYNLILNPLAAFVREYILKKGFLDGVRGLAVAASVTFYTFVKYLYLWELQRVNGRAKG
jgi:glycosyltransferase involved in cell wall biosynthesis